MDLNKLRDSAYKCACEKGFHDKALSNEHFLMLVVTELSEAVEADRKGKIANSAAFVDTIDIGGFCPGFYEEFIKGSIEEELADSAIRLLDLAGLKKIDLSGLSRRISVNGKLCSVELDRKYGGLEFTRMIFNVVVLLANKDLEMDTIIRSSFYAIFAICEHLNINIFWHIEQKMKYNELRESMHGKKY